MRIKCELCNKTFPYKHDLLRHLQTHTDERGYACDACEKKFKTRDNLRNHSLEVHGKKSVASNATGTRCDVCGKRFKDLEYHKLSHSKKKQFHCDLCDLSFYKESTLLMHVKRHKKIVRVKKQVIGFLFVK